MACRIGLPHRVGESVHSGVDVCYFEVSDTADEGYDEREACWGSFLILMRFLSDAKTMKVRILCNHC